MDNDLFTHDEEYDCNRCNTGFHSVIHDCYDVTPKTDELRIAYSKRKVLALSYTDWLQFKVILLTTMDN